MTVKKQKLDALDIRIMEMVSLGLSDPAIGRRVHLSAEAVAKRVVRIRKLLNADNRPHAVRRAIEERYIMIGEK